MTTINTPRHVRGNEITLAKVKRLKIIHPVGKRVPSGVLRNSLCNLGMLPESHSLSDVYVWLAELDPVLADAYHARFSSLDGEFEGPSKRSQGDLTRAVGIINDILISDAFSIKDRCGLVTCGQGYWGLKTVTDLHNSTATSDIEKINALTERGRSRSKFYHDNIDTGTLSEWDRRAVNAHTKANKSIYKAYEQANVDARAKNQAAAEPQPSEEAAKVVFKITDKLSGE